MRQVDWRVSYSQDTIRTSRVMRHRVCEPISMRFLGSMLVAIRKRWATTRDQSVPGLFSKHLSNQLERIQHMDKQSAVRKRAVAFTETETEGTSNHTRLDHTSHLTKSSNLFAIFDHLRVRCGYNT